MNDRFKEALLSRFEGRNDLGHRGLYEKYFKSQGLPEDEVVKCFKEVEFNFHIPVGILRPNDDMSKLMERVTTNSPLVWLWSLGRNEFRGDDLLEELNVRLTKYGTFDDWQVINSFDDLVRAWCGHKPA